MKPILFAAAGEEAIAIFVLMGLALLVGGILNIERYKKKLALAETRVGWLIGQLQQANEKIAALEARKPAAPVAQAQPQISHHHYPAEPQQTLPPPRVVVDAEVIELNNKLLPHNKRNLLK